MWPQREKVFSESLYTTPRTKPAASLSLFLISLSLPLPSLPLLHPLLLAVANEGPKLAGVGVVVEGDQKVFVELEGGGELLSHLPHTVQELSEDWRRLLLLHHCVSTSLGELVSARQPLLLYEYLRQCQQLIIETLKKGPSDARSECGTDHESMERVVVGVEEERCEGTGLSRSVPAIGTVDQDAGPCLE